MIKFWKHYIARRARQVIEIIPSCLFLAPCGLSSTRLVLLSGEGDDFFFRSFWILFKFMALSRSSGLSLFLSLEFRLQMDGRNNRQNINWPGYLKFPLRKNNLNFLKEFMPFISPSFFQSLLTRATCGVIPFTHFCSIFICLVALPSL